MEFLTEQTVGYGVIIILLICICYHLRLMCANKEHMVSLGTPLANILSTGADTSGANIRHTGQLSGTNQGKNPLSNVDVATVSGGRVSGTGMATVDYLDGYDRASQGDNDYESLVNTRGMPDFWEVGNELAAYQKSQTPGMRKGAGVEHMEDARDLIGQYITNQETGKLW